tara:strand:+ start:52 stop:951 length:900 start_codon:yes stop_codon:yes gene_type:complete
MDQIDDQDLLFNVEAEDVYTIKGRRVPNKKALINMSTEDVMSVVSSNYKVVTNEEIFSSFCRSVEASSIRAEGASVKVRQTPNGARAMVDFIFPEESIKMYDDESKTALQLCALNSFDGTTRYLTKAGGLRMKCLNGQILGHIVGSYSSTHTESLCVEEGAKSVIAMIEQFQSAQNYWGAMMLTKVDTDVATSVFKDFLGIKQNDQLERQNARLQRCLNLWSTYCYEMGSNAYALYNVLTHYVSHQEKEYKNPTQAMMHQRNQIEKTLRTSQVFKEAEEKRSGIDYAAMSKGVRKLIAA